ncbi:unnamed protein product, partial [Mesorhabditis spiculigera]
MAFLRLASLLAFLLLRILADDSNATSIATEVTTEAGSDNATEFTTIQTTTIPSCSVNETYKECGECENSCNMSTAVCSNACGPPKCECLDGFYRNETGSCVQGHDCGEVDLNISPLQQISGTEGGLCDDGTGCTEGYTCMQVENCPAAICTDYTTSCIIPNCTLQSTCIADASCQCTTGFYRNFTGFCVQGHDCGVVLEVTELPSTDSILTGCELVRCQPGSTCRNIEGTATCVNVTIDACPMNEEWKDCASQCEPTCDTPKPVCPALCATSACQCQEGFYRNDNGTCVVLVDCFSTPITCSTNEEAMLYSTCEPSCETPDLQCALPETMSLNLTCLCKAGFVRNSLGNCVNTTSCNATIPSDCTTVTCPLDKYCDVVDGSAKCIEGTAPTTMSTVTQFTTTGSQVTGGNNTVTVSVATTTTTANSCGKNERSTKCVHGCEPMCSGRQYCPTNSTVCTPGCLCAYGYKRGPKLTCVQTSKCHKNPGCQANEAWIDCMDDDPKCSGVTPAPHFGTVCSGGCGCVTGYQRNAAGDCVLAANC